MGNKNLRFWQIMPPGLFGYTIDSIHTYTHTHTNELNFFSISFSEESDDNVAIAEEQDIVMDIVP
jgi:hypothetical protein